MKIMTANLKLLYQNREMWAWYLFMGIGIWHISSSFYTPKSIPSVDYMNNWDLIAPVFVLTILGCAMGRFTAGIWTKPAIFCIPGQIETSRKMLLFIGLAVSALTYLIITIITSWIILRYPGTIISLLGFYLMIYIVSVITSIRFNKLCFVIPYFILFIMPLMNRMEILSFIQNLLLAHPWRSALVCWIINFLTYYAVGTRYMPRHICGAPSMTFFVSLESAGSNRDSLDSLKKDRFIKKVAETINRLFFQLIQSNNRSLILHHMWGRAYVIAGSFISNWRKIFFDGPVIFLSAATIINSIRIIELQSFLYSFIGLLGGHICIMSGSDIFIPLDRRGRFFSKISALITATFIMLVLAAMLNVLSKILPNNFTKFISLTGPTDASFLNSKYIFFTMILLPVTGGLLILFRKKSFLSVLLITGITIFLLGTHYQLIDNMGYIFNMSSLFVVIPAIILSVGIYLAITYYDSMKRSLS